MNENILLVECLSDLNNIIKSTFKPMQRIKLVCFDSSPNLLVFGATSGGIYIFKKQPCSFLKLIPSKEGSARLLSVSKDEQYIGVASSKGLILVLDQFLGDSSNQYQVFTEHEGSNITYIKWHMNELYVGDESGKVSVVSVMAGFQTKAIIFQVPAAALMTLDSEIVQIDAFQSYLLVSTRTKTYLCDTEKENYIQVGKKLRDGGFGACFCHIADTAGKMEVNKIARNPSQSLKEIESCNAKIYCARPGARIWEAGCDAKVSVTYQFKSTLDVEPTNYLVIGSSEESVMQKRQYVRTEKVPDNFNFQRIYPLCDKFILTRDSERVFIFDPASSKLMFWTSFKSGIKDVAVISNMFYVWKNNLEVNIFSVVDLESLLLSTLYNKQYCLCADLCTQYTKDVLLMLENSKNLYLLSVLETKIASQDILEKIQPVLDKVKGANDVLFTRQLKDNIVVVKSLYTNGYGESHRKTKKIDTEIEDAHKDLKVIMKQYKLNKTHSLIDIPEVTELLGRLAANELFLTLNRFIDYVAVALKEDSTDWCQDQLLKQIFNRNISVRDLNTESVVMLTEAVIKSNESQHELSCQCGYPLPKCHKTVPKFYETVLDIFSSVHDVDQMLIRRIPYLWKHKVKTESRLNMMALIQFGQLELLKEHTLQLAYDNWHDIIGYFVKLNKGFCLNCGKQIDPEGLFTWPDLAKCMVQSLGAKNAIRILQKYETVIPNGALDVSFYQTCIFANSFIDDSRHEAKVDAEAPFKFIDDINEPELGNNQLNDLMVKYFKKKHSEGKNCTFHYALEGQGPCAACNLPLNNVFLSDCEHLRTCKHTFHTFCFERNNRVCSICK